MVMIHGKTCANQHDMMVSVLLHAGGIDAETLRPKGSPGKVADVYFPAEQWIFEVKSLEVDRPASPAVQARLGERLLKDAPKFGGPILFGTKRIDLQQLPEPTAWNVLRILGRAAQDAVDMANLQIKDTKKYLPNQSPKGCVVIVCPPHELDHDVLMNLIADRIRDGRNSSIDLALIAQSPLLAPFGRKTGSSSLVFRGRNGARPSQELVSAIGQAWADAHGQPLVASLPPNKGK